MGPVARALDEYSARSHAARRQRDRRRAGWPGDPAGPARRRPIDADQGIRPEASVEKLATLKPAFEGLELLTAGNSSQISDGAAAMLIASREKAEELGCGRARASSSSPRSAPTRS